MNEKRTWKDYLGMVVFWLVGIIVILYVWFYV